MIRIVNSKITPALTSVKTISKNNKNGEPYMVHQVFPLDESKVVDYARPPKKVYPICNVYANGETPLEEIEAATTTSIETVYPNKNSSIFCKVNQTNDPEYRSSTILIAAIPYRGSLISANAESSVLKKALVISTTPFKYMEQKCEFNKIMYLILCTDAANENITINFKTTAVHRDDKSDKADLYTRTHKAVITKGEDGEYTITSLEIVDQTNEKIDSSDLGNTKNINEIFDIAIDDIQKADEKKPNNYKSNDQRSKKFDDNEKGGYKKPYNKKTYKKDSYDPNSNYKPYTSLPKESVFNMQFNDDRARKTARRLNKSKSRYDD